MHERRSARDYLRAENVFERRAAELEPLCLLITLLVALGVLVRLAVSCARIA
jgi:hypothetical protein